jgi:hypothetical protein
MKNKFLKYYPFWLGLIVLIFINGIPILREAPSFAMILMYIIGYFKLTKLH